MTIEIRGWGLENDRLTVGHGPQLDRTQAVRDSIREELPKIIEATLGEWLSRYEKKQGVWFQEVLNAQQGARLEAKVDELVETIDRYQGALDDVLVQMQAGVRDAVEGAMKDAVVRAMEAVPRAGAPGAWPEQPGPGPQHQFGAEGRDGGFERAASDPSGSEKAPRDGLQPPSGFERAASDPSEQSGLEQRDRSKSGPSLVSRGGPRGPEEPVAPEARAPTMALSRAPTAVFSSSVKSLRSAGLSVYGGGEDYLEERAASPWGPGSLGYFVHSRAFEHVMMVVIVLHVAYMIYETNLSAARGATSTGIGHLIVECVFWLAYTTELVLKIIVEREYFFHGPVWTLHLLDAFLVASGLIDLIALVLADARVLGTMGLRVIRVIRLNRLARPYRLFLLSDDMQLLMKSLAACAIGLVGPFCLILGYFLVMSLWIVPVVTGHLADNADTLPAGTREFLDDQFGSVQRSMFALYQSFNGGSNWMPVFEPLSDISLPAVGAPYVVYHFVYAFLMVNVVLCMFLGKIAHFSLDNSQTAKHDQSRQDRQDVKWILRWLEKEYGAGDAINYKDFLRLMSKIELRHQFAARKVTMDDAGAVFKALAPEPTQEGTAQEWDFSVGRRDFVEACMRIKHEVTVTDVVAGNASIIRSLDKQRGVCQEVLSKVGELERRVKAAARREQATGAPLAPRRGS